VFQANPRVPGAPIVKTEEFIRLVIEAGVERYVQGLATLELWHDGTEGLRDIETRFIFMQDALKFVSSNKDFLSLLWPIASLVLTLEEASTPNLNLPAAVRLLLARKTAGLTAEGEHITLLRWLWNSNQFSKAAVQRLAEGGQTEMLSQVTELSEEQVMLEQIASLCRLAATEETFVSTISAHVAELHTTLKQLRDQTERVLLMYDPRPGKLDLTELFDTAATLVSTLAEYDAEDKEHAQQPQQTGGVALEAKAERVDSKRLPKVAADDEAKLHKLM
jgi:hypothetical protein